MKTHPKIFSIVIFMVSIANQPSWAYDSKHVHVSINHHAALSAETFKLDCLAKEFLGFPRGIERTSVYAKPILKWLEEGGTDEDENPRWLHHFHDPMVPWHKAGLNDSILGSSSAIWAQRDGIDGTSWEELRNLYYLALVEGEEGFWSRMFYGLGHLMHLVADLACPAHTRDDMHPEGDIYEKWAELNSEILDYQPFPVDRQIFTQAVLNDLVPITALWDQDVYDQQFP